MGAGVPYLIAAYGILLGSLVGYFLYLWRGTKALEEEGRSLSQRIDKAGEASSDV